MWIAVTDLRVILEKEERISAPFQKKRPPLIKSTPSPSQRNDRRLLSGLVLLFLSLVLLFARKVVVEKD